MILGMALLAFAFLFIHVSPDSGEDGPPPGATAWAFVAVFAMCAFCISYALGLGNVAWVVQSEVSFLLSLHLSLTEKEGLTDVWVRRAGV